MPHRVPPHQAHAGRFRRLVDGLGGPDQRLRATASVRSTTSSFAGETFDVEPACLQVGNGRGVYLEAGAAYR